jgi:peptidoglycan-N-acetylglucosamine deacetylase
MRTWSIARHAAASAAIAGLAACGGVSSPGAQPGTPRTSVAPCPAPVMPAPSTATPGPGTRTASVPPGRPSPRPPATSPGPPAISGWLAGKDWTSIPTTRHVVALTFDAGANAFVTLDTLTG